MNMRRSDRVVELKPTFLGLKSGVVQDALNQLGAQGRELVTLQNMGWRLRLSLEKEQ